MVSTKELETGSASELDEVECGITVMLPAGSSGRDFVVRFPNGDALSLLCPAVARLLGQLPEGESYLVDTEAGTLMLGVTDTPADTQDRFEILIGSVGHHESLAEELGALEREMRYPPSPESQFTPSVPLDQIPTKPGINWMLLGRVTLLVLGTSLAGVALLKSEEK